MAIDVYLQIDGIKGESRDAQQEQIGLQRGDVEVLPAENRGRRPRQDSGRVGPGNKSGGGMRPVTAVMVALALVSGDDAQAAPYRAHMTGEQLVRDVLAAPDGGVNSIRRERAMGYMAGVMDAAAGMRWCPAGSSVSHELDYVVAEEMQKLPPLQLKCDGAALVLAVLAKLYPCGARR